MELVLSNKSSTGNNETQQYYNAFTMYTSKIKQSQPLIYSRYKYYSNIMFQYP